LATKNNISDVIKLQCDPSGCESARKNRYFLFFVFKVKRLKLAMYRFFSLQNRSGDRFFHEINKRDQRGLYLPNFLRLFEGNAISTCTRDTINKTRNGLVKNYQGDNCNNTSDNVTIHNESLVVANE